MISERAGFIERSATADQIALERLEAAVRRDAEPHGPDLQRDVVALADDLPARQLEADPLGAVLFHVSDERDDRARRQRRRQRREDARDRRLARADAVELERLVEGVADL